MPIVNGCRVSQLRYRIAVALDPAMCSQPSLSWTNRLVITAILISLVLVTLETEPYVASGREHWFLWAEWFFVIVFSLEYAARVWSSIENPEYTSRWYYATRLSSLIDFIVVFLILLNVIGMGAIASRLFKVISIIRIAKLSKFSQSYRLLISAFVKRKFELMLSGCVAFFLIFFSSSILYLVEGRVQPEAFGSIPRAMWWSTVTLTTVGYGDVYPMTAIGKFFSMITAIAGIGLIAMPTGILAAAFSEAVQESKQNN